MESAAAGVLVAAVALYTVGMGLSFVLQGGRGLLTSSAIVTLAGAMDVIFGGTIIVGHGAFEMNLYRLPPLGMLQIRADPLTGLFLILIGAVSIGVAVYSAGYMRRFTGAGYRTYSFLLNLLVLSLLGVVLANDLPLFLIAWETMSIVSYLLVAFEHDDEHAADAGFFMLAMSQLGTGAFLIGFLLLGGSVHGLGFDQMRAGMSEVPEAVRTGAFLFLFFGFGTKAGIAPLHVWLPIAHPAAPSNISALLSAIIINMGVYGIIRFAVEMVGTGPAWWGFTVSAIGAISAILGILYALMERDIKRFLAYSSVENIGIILIGVGASMMYASLHLPVLAALAMIAALFHTVNHAAYKGLLFLGAGAIDSATGIRNMDRLGGLIRFMPWTAGLFLIGALSIAALPPFNGFISEWLTLESLIQSFHISHLGLHDLQWRLGIALVGALLALTAGLAVTAFVKAYGVTFLGVPRTAGLARVREVRLSMRWGMGVLALEALVLGVLPTTFIPAFARVAATLYGPNIANVVVPPVYTRPGDYPLLIHLGGALFHPIVPAPGPIVIPAYASFAAASPTYLAISFLLGVPLVGAIGWLIMRVRSARHADVWAGGIELYTSNYQYTSSSYANPIRIIFGMIFRPRKEAETRIGSSPYFRLAIDYRASVVPFFERYAYPAIVGPVVQLAKNIGIVQSGSVNLYLLYFLGILVIALLGLQ